MRLTVIGGPTTTRHDGGLSSDQTIVSFEDRLNAKLEELEAQGITSYTVDCKPDGHGWHYGYISFETPELATVAIADPEHLTVPQMAKRLNVSPTWVYERIRWGEIKALPLGKRKVVPFTEYTRLATPS